MFSDLTRIVARADALIDRIEALLSAPTAHDWQALAYRWKTVESGLLGRRGGLVPVAHPHTVRLVDLHDIDEQKARLVDNTAQFVAGRTANNTLLTGARGTGKSSLVKALLPRFAARGLRLIEVDRADLADLPDIAALLADRRERFIVFIDDLSFEGDDGAYKTLKSVLDGGIAAPTENMLVYATSNRRHLMSEKMSENREAVHTDDGEIRPGETTEEKISLSERFGLWLSFYPFDQEQYLDIAEHWVAVLAPAGARIDRTALRRAALLWALERGGRSGRIAYQFARDFAGKCALPRPAKRASTRKKRP